MGTGAARYLVILLASPTLLKLYLFGAALALLIIIELYFGKWKHAKLFFRVSAPGVRVVVASLKWSQA
jgi:hypothetical protein